MIEKHTATYYQSFLIENVFNSLRKNKVLMRKDVYYRLLTPIPKQFRSIKEIEDVTIFRLKTTLPCISEKKSIKIIKKFRKSLKSSADLSFTERIIYLRIINN